MRMTVTIVTTAIIVPPAMINTFGTVGEEVDRAKWGNEEWRKHDERAAAQWREWRAMCFTSCR
jgi:hypothetical protein